MEQVFWSLMCSNKWMLTIIPPEGQSTEANFVNSKSVMWKGKMLIGNTLPTVKKFRFSRKLSFKHLTNGYNIRSGDTTRWVLYTKLRDSNVWNVCAKREGNSKVRVALRNLERIQYH